MNKEKIMSKEAFDELIDNLEIIERMTLYGRKSIKHWVKALQKENEEKDKQIDIMVRAFRQDDVRSVEEIKQYFERKSSE